MFKLICDIKVDNIIQENPSNNTMEHSGKYIKYTNCQPCFFGTYSLTNTSNSLNPEVAVRFAELNNNKNGLNPYNPNYKLTYDKVLADDPANYKYIAIAEDNNNFNSTFDDIEVSRNGKIERHKVFPIYESIIKSPEETIWHKFSYILTTQPISYRKGVLKKITINENESETLMDEYFFDYLKKATDFYKCQRLDDAAISSNRKSDTVIYKDYKDEIKDLLRAAINQEYYKTKQCEMGGIKVAFIDTTNDPKSIETLCTSLGGKLVPVIKVVENFCSTKEADHVVAGNELMSITCANYSELLGGSPNLHDEL